MVLLLGGIQMIIEKIEIYNLHGEYNYKIDFDRKLTFLHGPNGCGKTTILNILASIVTGKLYNLTDYTFSKIVLNYMNENEDNEEIVIRIEKIDKNIRKMIITFQNEPFEIEDIDNLKEILFRKTEDDNLDRSFYSMYPFAEKIKEVFNYVYLPLNRYGNGAYDAYRDYYRYSNRRFHFIQQQNPYNTYLNESLQYVAELIRDSCININVEENRINNNFRNDVLTSSIRVSSDMPIGQIFQDIDQCKWDEVLKSKEVYIKTLIEIGVYDVNLQNKIEQFFVEFEDAYNDYQSRSNNKKTGIKVDFAWQYAEFLKIKSIAELAKENEKIKEVVRRPKEVFIEVINDFFISSGSDKKIMVNSEGQVYFDTHSQKLKLQDLSSGEKQLIITFTSLIFGLKGKNKGIFIVDEPEASLHLEWQSKFVPAILKANENIQLIFATHSPELIGKYRSKAVKLVRL